MNRVTAVVVIAALCAALFGVDQSDAAQDTTSRQRIVSRVANLKVGDIVKLERTDGTKIEGILIGKTGDSVTVDVYRQRAFRNPQLIGTETIALDDLKDIGKPLSGARIALITASVLVGTCAIAAVAVSASLEGRAGGPPTAERGSMADPSDVSGLSDDQATPAAPVTDAPAASESPFD